MFLAFNAVAQADFQIAERGANQRIWQRDEWIQLNDGRTVNRPRRLVEQASGLHYLENGQWAESRAEIEIGIDGTAAATHGQHTVHWAQDGTVALNTPDGKLMRSRVLGLAYTDGDQSALIAPLQNTVGMLLPPNELVFPAALGAAADIRYTYTKAALEQDIIIRENLHPPTSYGMNPDRTRLEVWTEFTDAPEPLTRERTLPNGLIDQSLNFGAMRIGRGAAFILGDLHGRVAGARIAKTWIVTRDNRRFLVEAVPYRAIEAELATLPPPQAAVQNLEKNSRLALLSKVSSRLPLDMKPIQLAFDAKAFDSRKGLVLDYVAINTATNPVTLAGDQTYYVSSAVYVTDLVIEGNTVVKFAADASIDVDGVVDCRTARYRPAIFTAKDDDSVGDKISGSSGNPSGTYAFWALGLHDTNNLHDIRVSYALYGVLTDIGSVINNAQFTFCDSAILLYGATVTTDNLLAYRNNVVYLGGLFTLTARHVTAHQCNYLFYNPDNDIVYGLTNSLFVNVTNWGTATVSYGTNAVVRTNDEATVRTVGAAAHYLTVNSPYRNAGVTNIPESLALELRLRTTHPPTVITNGRIDTNLILGISAPRGTTIPDLGYAYAPLDYVFGSNVLTNATLTIPAGVAVGTFTPGSNTHGLLLLSGANINSSGSPTNLVRIVRYNTVQEQANTAWIATSVGPQIRIPSTNTAVTPVANFRFTDWSVPALGLWHLDATPTNKTALLFRDCQFAGGKIHSAVAEVAFTNCLFNRVDAYCEEYPATNINRFYHNTFYGGTWTFYNSRGGAWEAFNNLFYNTADLSSDAGFPQGWNAYLPGAPMISGWLSNGIATNIVFQCGPLGDFYLTNTSPLLNRGTNGATTYGLYHFTTTTNQLKETNSTADIGFHLVALTSSGIPLDSDGDGIPDFYEDANGNGDAETNGPLFETNWRIDDGSDDPDGDWLTNLQEFEAGTNPQDRMLVAWGYNDDGQCDVPRGLRNPVSVAGGFDHSVAALVDGSVVCWGDNTRGQTNIPAGLGDVVALSAGPYHQIALRRDGTVSHWGQWWDGAFYSIAAPSGLSTVVGIAAGADHDLALRSDGSLFVWGQDTNAAYNTVPTDLSNVVAVAAGWDHNVALKADGTVRAWGYSFGDYGWNTTNVPAGLSNVTAIAAGGYHTLALKSDGRVVGWGAGSPTNSGWWADQGQSTVPSNLSNVMAIAAGGYSSMALLSNGTVVVWGELAAPSFSLTNIERIALGNGPFGLAVRHGRLTPLIRDEPSSQTNQAGQTATFAAVALGLDGVKYQWQFNGMNLPLATNASLSLANLSSSEQGNYQLVVSTGAGSVTSLVASLTVSGALPGDLLAWGSNSNRQTQVPWNLRDIIAAAGSARHTLAVKDGGNAVAWGTNDFGQTNVPTSATNVIAAACGDDHSLALRENGTVIAWGRNQSSQTNVPSDATNVLAISAGGHQSLALLKNGSVKQWGQTFVSIPSNVSSNVNAIASGTNFHLALLTNTTVVAWGANAYGQTNVPAGLSNVVSIAAGGAHGLALKADGKIVSWGANTSGQTNVPTSLSNVMALAAGYAHSVAMRNDGSVVAWGDNAYGQTNIPTVATNARVIAAGAYHTMAAIDSRFAEYPVDVSRDLLLICNTNVESVWVKDYYLTHRPLVSNANVLTISYAPQETISRPDFTNVFRTPVLNWLTNNPTKRPHYWILFLDVPSRINQTTNLGLYVAPFDGSVSYELSLLPQARSPLINHINMGATNHLAETNACKAYIDKLADFGTNYSPGKLVISAGASGYGNTNYYFDDTRIYPPACCLPSVAWAGRNGVVEAGVPTTSVTYSNAEPDTGWSVHITTANNVAGYLCWGAHSSLGAYYAMDGATIWQGQSGWWIIETVESLNGWRFPEANPQGNFMRWFSPTAFGGTNYLNTPVGAVTHTDEPSLGGVNDAAKYFGYWARGKLFVHCAWNSRQTERFQAVGDPFLRR